MFVFFVFGPNTDRTIRNNAPIRGEKIDDKLVYVIGLHAVQFGNNWMKKIPRTAKIGRGRRPSPIWLSEEFFESNWTVLRN